MNPVPVEKLYLGGRGGEREEWGQRRRGMSGRGRKREKKRGRGGRKWKGGEEGKGEEIKIELTTSKLKIQLILEVFQLIGTSNMKSILAIKS